ncbi:MAG: vWA domain-containing protein [Pirellulales bacterium]
MAVEQISAKSQSGSTRPGWSGAPREPEAGPQRQWEGGAAPGIDRYFRSARRRWKARILALLLLSLALTAAYLVLLAHFPQRTPLIVVAVEGYSWPLAPNAWSREDVQAFKRLDGQTVRVLDASANWKSRQHILTEWERTLQKVADSPSETNSAVFYLSVHGIVDAEGAPCLLPPNASTLERDEWVAVDELLQRMKSILPSHVHKLLILDCTRQLDNWNAGIVHNTFAQRVAELAQQRTVPNLAILNSTSAGERAWASPELRGSIFGRTVLLGLAGEADRIVELAAESPPGSTSKKSVEIDPFTGKPAVDKVSQATSARQPQLGGNGDGRVSLLELQIYVAREVERWSLHHRQATQSPRLAPADVADFVLAWNVNPRSLAKLRQELEAVTRPADSVHEDEIHALWSSLDALRPLEVERVDPIAFHDLENRLVSLEQTAVAGEAYKETSEKTYQDLRKRLDAAAKQAELLQARPTLAAELTLFDDARSLWPRTLPIASLCMAEQLGTLSAAQAKAVEAAIAASAAGGGEPLPAETELPRERSERLSDVHWQRIVRWYHVDGLWADANRTNDFQAARLKLEEIAARHDPRAHRRLRAALDEADVARRRAEDWLLAGESAGDVNPVAALQAAFEQLAGRDDSPAAMLDRAWSVRDAALAEIPIWARWLASAADESSPVLERLPKLVVTAFQLNERLDADPDPNVDDAQEILNLANQLQTELDALRRDFAAECAQLEKEPAATGQICRRIEHALLSPHIPAPQRLALRRALARNSKELFAPKSAATASEVSAAEYERANDVLQRVSSWRTHPLTSVLWSPQEQALLKMNPDDFAVAGTDEFWKQMERTASRLRSRLRDIQAASRGQVNASTDVAAAGTQKPDLERRSKITERNTRLAAALWMPVTPNDAILTRRRRDLQRVLLWFAGRSLEDAYGSGPRNPLVPVPPPPFFEQSVGDYLVAASLIAPLDAESKAETERLRVQLANRSLAMKRWASLRVARRDSSADGQTALYEATIVPASAAVSIANDASAAAAGKPDALARGAATAFLRSADRRPVGGRSTLELPLVGEEVRVPLSAPIAAAQDLGLEAVLLFRGHELPEAIDDRLPTGLVIESRNVRPSSAQVTVVGDRRQRSSIVFILDCSGSMASEIAVEAAGPATLPRLELARSSLLALLDQLAVRGDARIGVRFFGHRVGFSTEKPVKVLRQESYPDPIPDDLHPSDDVELYLPLGRFDSVEAGRVTQRVQRLKPWGQSPLYRSLLQARDDFEGEASDVNRSVVVITDGENYQYAGSDPALKAPQPATAQEVQAAFAGAKTPIYILGFGVTSADNPNAEREFTQLAEATGGGYFPVQNGRDLLKTLRTRLGLGTYTVVDGRGQPASGAERGESSVRLNTPVPIGDLSGAAQPYTVRFESAAEPIELEGGESIVLQATADGRDLSAIPYEQGLPTSDMLSTAGRKERFTVRAHRPQLEGRTARFRVSWQDEDLRFTPRPAELWIEIKPILADAGVEAQSYVFYDRQFASDEPVPVVDCVATNWPSGARQAEVRVWSKATATPAVQDVPLADVLANRERFQQPQVVSGADGLQFVCSIHESPGGAGPWEVRVVTQLTLEGSDIAHLRVLWDGEFGVRPLRVVHRYEVSRRQAVHSFWFPAETAPKSVADGKGRIAFTHRSATRDGAFRTPNDRPLVVDVQGASDTLPLDAASGTRGTR